MMDKEEFEELLFEYRNGIDISYLDEVKASLIGAFKEQQAEIERLRVGLIRALSITEGVEELNMLNYDHDLVCQLNDGMNDVYACLKNLVTREEGKE